MNPLIDAAKEYASKKIDLLKLEATEKSSIGLGIIAFLVLILVALLFFFILLIIGLGLLIGYLLDNYAYGILIMAGFYLLALFILFYARKSIINSIANKILKVLND